jgi:hypothetical protein
MEWKSNLDIIPHGGIPTKGVSLEMEMIEAVNRDSEFTLILFVISK